MADTTAIAWTTHTFNPWLGCTKVSPGCANCYAETIVKTKMGGNLWGPKGNRRVTSADYWKKPTRWNRDAKDAGEKARVFCGSMMDWCEDHPTANEARPKLFAIIRETPWLDWQLLTKRPENLTRFLPNDWSVANYPNVWLGTSVEDQKRADLRIPILLATPAHVHFLSVEPQLEDVSLIKWLDNVTYSDTNELMRINDFEPDIQWVIVGGESGPGHRPMDHAWARRLRDECAAADVAFFFKQSAAYRTEMGIELMEADGSKAIHRDYPVSAPVALTTMFA